MGTYGSRSLSVGGSAIVKAVDKVIAKGRKIAAHLLEALELGPRVGMIINPKIEGRVVLGRVDAKRCRLLATLVATGSLAGLQGPDQPAGKGQIGAFNIDTSRLGNHLRAGQHVAGHRKPLMDDMAAPGDAIGPGMRRNGAPPVLQMDLARFAPWVGGEQQIHHDLRRHAFAQQAQPTRAKSGIDQGLGRQTADAAIGMSTERADCKKPRGDRHTKGTGNGITCNDRPGHDSKGRSSKGKRIRQCRRASADLNRRDRQTVLAICNDASNNRSRRFASGFEEQVDVQSFRGDRHELGGLSNGSIPGPITGRGFR
jgi:hypothetical protein